MINLVLQVIGVVGSWRTRKLILSRCSLWAVISRWAWHWKSCVQWTVVPFWTGPASLIPSIILKCSGGTGSWQNRTFWTKASLRTDERRISSWISCSTWTEESLRTKERSSDCRTLWAIEATHAWLTFFQISKSNSTGIGAWRASEGSR
jgi:hypothetical protein